jgi:hypothetical protein
MKNKTYIVKKGDTLWDLSRRFLGAPTQWCRIYSYNNRPEVVRATGKAIENPDLIFPGQKILLPILPQQPKIPKKVKPKEYPPASLKARIHKTYVPFASMYKLDDLPLLEYESFTTPGFKASISFQGDVAIRLADKVPLSHVTNRGLEIHYKSMTDAVLGQLLQDSTVEWDKTTNKISYACNMVSHSDTPHAPSTSIGVALASDKPMPILRAEIRYPELKGYFQRNFFMAVNVKVVIDLEPRSLVVKGPEVMHFDQRQVFDSRQVPMPRSQENFNGWYLLLGGAFLLGASILTDFLGGAGVPDDAVTIPAALAAMKRGLERIIFPAVATGAAAACSSSPNSQGVTGMKCKAAHTQ